MKKESQQIIKKTSEDEKYGVKTFRPLYQAINEIASNEVSFKEILEAATWYINAIK